MTLLLVLLLGQAAGYAVPPRYRTVVRLLATYAPLILSHDISHRVPLMTAPFYPLIASGLAANMFRGRASAIEAMYAAASVATAVSFDPAVVPLVTRLLAEAGTVRPLLTVAVYLATVFGGGLLVKTITTPFFAKLDTDHASLPRAGQFIGWAERFLILTFVLNDAYEPIGYLVAAKTAARFPTIKDEVKVAEYYLIGTLMSLAVAALGGTLLRLSLDRL